jgi:hypothetical protein
MKIAATLLAIAALALASIGSALAAPTASYRWTSDDRWAFIDSYTKEIQYDGYLYPNLLADCVQKAAAGSFPSYRAWIFAPKPRFNAWLHSPRVVNCLLDYGDKY